MSEPLWVPRVFQAHDGTVAVEYRDAHEPEAIMFEVVYVGPTGLGLGLQGAWLTEEFLRDCAFPIWTQLKGGPDGQDQSSSRNVAEAQEAPPGA